LIGKISDARLLAAAIVVAPSLAMLAPLGMAPLLALLAIALLAVEWRRPLVLAWPLRALTILLAALALWGGASTAWSIIPAHSLFEAARFALLSLAGLVVVAAALTLSERGRSLVGRASVVGFVLAIAVLAIELLGDFPIRRAFSGAAPHTLPLAVLDRGATVLALACWVPILFLIERRRPAAAVAVFTAALIALQLLISLSAFVALSVAAGGFALAWWRPRAAALLLAGGFVALAAVLPFCAPTRDTVIWLSHEAPWLRTSAQHRLIIWRFSHDRIAERPLLGWGMDAAREIPGGKTSVRDYMALPDELLLEGSVMPLHPHDAILQWTLELGIVGVLLGSAIVVRIAWLVGFAGTPSRATRAAGFGVIAASLPPLLLSFGVWQAWWQSTLWLVAALIVATGAETFSRPEEKYSKAR
jgi:exopolysaccharide production protein ExoQ